MIADTTYPSFTNCPSTVTVAANGSCGYPYDPFSGSALPTATDNCAIASLTQTLGPTLPTTLGLGATTFLRSQQLIRYDHGALQAVRAGIRALSDAENLPAHGDAVDARFPPAER